MLRLSDALVSVRVLPAVAAAALWAAAAGAAVFWWLHLPQTDSGAQTPVSVMPVPQATQGTASVLRALGHTSAEAKAPDVQRRFQLLGVIAADSGQGSALLAVDGPPARAQHAGCAFGLAPAKRRALARVINWSDVEHQLQRFLQYPKPISVLEAARVLDVEARQLYLHANKTTRQLGKRWEAYRKRCGEANLERAMPIIESVGRELIMEGRAVTRREVEARVPPEVLSSVPRLFDVLRDVQGRIESERLGNS